MGLPLPPRSSCQQLCLLLTCFTVAVRFGLQDVLLSQLSKPSQLITRAAIYDAGVAGVQLAAALRLAGAHNVELFLDDAPDLWRR